MAKDPYSKKPPPEVIPTQALERREVTFFPPPWTEKLDEKLFGLADLSLKTTGTIYPAILKFAESRKLTIDMVQQRFHRITKPTQTKERPYNS